MTHDIAPLGRLTDARTALVAGGAGFLGSHLCDRLIAEGFSVICLDNFLTGHEANISHLQGHGRFRLLRSDVTEPLDFAVDAIYNFACPASPVHYQIDPVRTLKTNVHGAINLLDLARRSNCRIFQASTSEVYGDPDVHPQTEGYWGNVNPMGPRSCYDEGKRCAETLFFDYHRQYGVDIKVARIFNTYGPRMHPNDGRVISNFIVQALRNENITICGDGRQTRSFCYVDDLLEGCLRLMRTPANVAGAVNLGNPSEHAIGEIAARIVALTGSRSTVVHLPLPQDDPRRRRPDISLARSLLDWEPRVDLSEGLSKTIAYFDRLLSA